MKNQLSPVPKTGLNRFVFIVKNHFIRLIELNLLFILFSIPVITLPAAIRALNHVLIHLFTHGTSYIWDDFRQEFRKSFLRITAIGWLVLLLPWSIVGWFFILNLPSAGVGAGIVLMPLSAIVFEYWSFLDSSEATDIKRSLVLAIRDWKVCLRLLIIPLLIYVVSAIFYLYTIVINTLIIFSVGQLAGYTIFESTSLFNTTRRHSLNE